MSNRIPTKGDLEKAIERAAGVAIRDLFAKYPDHHFYYISLITSGHAHTPCIAAWSEESLEEATHGAVDREDARKGLKWSYADSPFSCFGGEHFAEVQRLFCERPDIFLLDDRAAEAEYELRLCAMESAMAKLDAQGLFGVGRERLGIVVNVEVMPPDYSNTIRARRLNPPEAIQDWLAEAAEDE